MEDIKLTFDGTANFRYIESAKRKKNFFKELIKKHFWGEFLIEDEENNYRINIQKESHKTSDGFLFFDESQASIVKYLKISYEGNLYLGIKFLAQIDRIRSINNLIKKIPQKFIKATSSHYYFEFPLKYLKDEEKVKMIIKFNNIGGNSELLNFARKHYKI